MYNNIIGPIDLGEKKLLGGYWKQWLISQGTTGQKLLTSASQILRIGSLPIHPKITKLNWVSSPRIKQTDTNLKLPHNG